MRPPCSSARCLARARPMPTPPVGREAPLDGLVVAVEDAGQVVRGDAAPGVGDRHPRLVGALGDAHRDGAALGRVLEGVAEQVRRPRCRGGAGRRRRRAWRSRRRHGEGDALGLGAARVDGLELPRQRAQVDRHHRQPQVPGVDAREVEQVVDEPQEPVGVAPHALEQLALHRRHRLGQPRLDGRGDERERRAQLVRDVGEELALEPVELLEPSERRLQVAGAVVHPLIELDVGLVDLVGALLQLATASASCRGPAPGGAGATASRTPGRRATRPRRGRWPAAAPSAAGDVAGHPHRAPREATAPRPAPGEPAPRERGRVLPGDVVAARVGALHLALQLLDLAPPAGSRWWGRPRTAPCARCTGLDRARRCGCGSET